MVNRGKRAADTTAEPSFTRRLERDRSVARARAAHFANYDARNDVVHEELVGGNVHTGGDDARTLGPWSSTVELLNMRDAAQSARQQKILGQYSTANKKNGYIWEPTRKLLSCPPKGVGVVSKLKNVAIDVIVEYIDDVESLVGLPDSIKSDISLAVCRRRKLRPETFALFTEGGPTEVCCIDCTSLDAATLQDQLLEAATHRLELLKLGSCGRGFTDAVAKSFSSACGGFPNLQEIALVSPYLLSDVGLAALLLAAPNLQRLQLRWASRIRGASILELPQKTPKLMSLDLTGCSGIDMDALCACLRDLPLLEELILDGHTKVDFYFFRALCFGENTLMKRLKKLSLSRCSSLDDDALQCLTPCQLVALRLTECYAVSPQGLSALFTRATHLKKLILDRCPAVDDSLVMHIAAHCPELISLSLNGCKVSSEGVLALCGSRCKQSLQEVNLSFCRKVDQHALGHLVDSCPALATLHVWGMNSHIGSLFLHGHSNDSLHILGLGEEESHRL